MTRRINFELTDEQLRALEGAINSDERAAVRQRAIAVRLLGLGYQPEQVAAMVMTKANTVYGWHRRYRVEGLEGLADKPRSGRPRKGTADYCKVLSETLETDPASYGDPFTVWTAERLRDHLEQVTGIRLSIGRFALLLEREGYVYRRPKADLTLKQNQSAKQQAAELLDELKKGRSMKLLSFSLWTKRPSV